MTLDRLFDRALDGAICLTVWVIALCFTLTVAAQTIHYLVRNGII